MRGREFYWKALYSFSKDETEHNKFYADATEAYKKIFTRAGIGDKTYITYASGGTFSKFSHEFQTVCESGEDIIYVDENKKLAINKELVDEESLMEEMGFDKKNLIEKRL